MSRIIELIGNSLEMLQNGDTSNNLLDIPRAVPHLGIPVSAALVDVRIINTTCYQRTKTENLLTSHVVGHDNISLPSYAFLITHRSQKTNVLFDLGMRKDWRKACPSALLPHISDDGRNTLLQVTVEKDVVDIIDSDPGYTGITSSDISAVIWSHHHFDHRGDMSRFPAHTKLIVGPGLLQEYLHSEVHESEIKGHEVVELGDTEFALEIGGYAAHDAFGDGSFYLLSCPGHTIGHICALARTTASPSTFVFLGGDCAYHCGEFRPSPYIPLPKQIAFKSTAWSFPQNAKLGPPVLQSRRTLFCAGEFVKDLIHPRLSATEAFYDTPKEPVVRNYIDACDSVAKMELFDAHDDVLVCISHDPHLMSVLPFYPYTLNDWYRKGYKRKLHWEFLNDFDLEENSVSPPLRR